MDKKIIIPCDKYQRPINYIPLAECIPGQVYLVAARNFRIAVFNGNPMMTEKYRTDTGNLGGFLGIREKFGSVFLDEEYHWDCGEPYGTTQPIEILCPLPDGIVCTESTQELFDFISSLVKDEGIQIEYVMPNGEKPWKY